MLWSVLLAVFVTSVAAHHDGVYFNNDVDGVVAFLLLLTLGVAILVVCSTPCTWMDSPPRSRPDVIRVQIVGDDMPRDRS
jgi:hypothetical protein